MKVTAVKYGIYRGIWLQLPLTVSSFLYSSAPGDFSPSVLSQNNHYVHLLSAGGVESVYVYVCIAVEGATVRVNQVGGHPSLSNHLTLMSLGEMHSYVSS